MGIRNSTQGGFPFTKNIVKFMVDYLNEGQETAIEESFGNQRRKNPLVICDPKKDLITRNRV